MKMKRTRKPIALNCDRSSESGIALLTVVMLLAIFALVLVGFTYTIRMEENTVANYAETVNVQEVTESALQGVLSQLDRDLNPENAAKYLLGREPSRYVSMLDPWYAGYGNFSGLVGGYNSTLTPASRPMGGDQLNPVAGQSISFDARAFQHDTRPDTEVRSVRDLKYYPLPMPLGIDEDPPGDVTGGPQRGYFPTQRGDGAPGLKGIDDNLDGLVDNSPYPDDDDEDFRVDEDHFDPRRPDARSGQYFFTPGTGYDNDGDAVGVFDESAKINLNYAGNTFGQGGRFTYNQGVGPHELDLEVFLYNRIYQYSDGGAVRTFTPQQAQELARQIVNFRYGSVADGGTRQAYPGQDNHDDDNTNNPMILEVERFSDAFRTSSFRGEPFAIIGNRLDDDGDGLLNEEDEIYIGPSTATRSGTPLDGPISQRMGDLKNFRMGDFIDNDGDGFIDQFGEGIDDPWEFDVFDPLGDDRPFASVDDLKLLAMLRNQVDRTPTNIQSPPPSLYNILRDSTTIWNQSDEISGPLSGEKNEVAKINPNAAATWRAQDVWDSFSGQPNHADFQYSPPIALEDLFPLQVDNDGDWNLRAEPDMERGDADGIDNDGDGQVDEPSDDWDGNYYPSGDWDGFGEPDVGSPATLTSGRDNDGDGAIDEGRQPGHSVGRLRRLPQNESDYESRPRNPNMQDLRYGIVVEGDGQDNDGDGVIDDIGDFNADGLVTYDPEPNVNEDGFGDASGDGFQIGRAHV